MSPNNALNGILNDSGWASALPAGREIGPEGLFGSSATMEVCSTSDGMGPHSSGPWLDVKNRYLAFAFFIDREVHYGWARLSVTVKSGSCAASAAVLTGYAYETAPGKPIAAGQTSGADDISREKRSQPTLGWLALGSMGLVAWRRDETAEISRKAVDSRL